jgi:cytochrome c peroxidase
VALSPEDRAKAPTAYDAIVLSIAAYEASPEVNAFTSKYDYYLMGMAALTKQGLILFKSKGKCGNCHVLDPEPNGEPPLLTDYTFDNLGLSRNPENPFYWSSFNPLGLDWVDRGLGGFLDSRSDYQPFAGANMGKQKVPTLRNVDLRPEPSFVKAYGHNGYFKSLWSIVHFYNTRDVLPRCVNPFTAEAAALLQGCWPEPEIGANINSKELGKLNMTADQEDAIVAFLKTLSDGYVPDSVQNAGTEEGNAKGQAGLTFLPAINNNSR